MFFWKLLLMHIFTALFIVVLVSFLTFKKKSWKDRNWFFIWKHVYYFLLINRKLQNSMMSCLTRKSWFDVKMHKNSLFCIKKWLMNVSSENKISSFSFVEVGRKFAITNVSMSYHLSLKLKVYLPDTNYDI